MERAELEAIPDTVEQNGKSVFEKSKDKELSKR
jgi:hypothetical protein